MAVTSAPTSQPLPDTPAFTRPELETQSRQAVVKVTSSRRGDSQAEVFTTNPQTSLQDASDQVSTENKRSPWGLLWHCESTSILSFNFGDASRIAVWGRGPVHSLPLSRTVPQRTWRTSVCPSEKQAVSESLAIVHGGFHTPSGF